MDKTTTKSSDAIKYYVNSEKYRDIKLDYYSAHTSKKNCDVCKKNFGTFSLIRCINNGNLENVEGDIGLFRKCFPEPRSNIYFQLFKLGNTRSLLVGNFITCHRSCAKKLLKDNGFQSTGSIAIC